MKTTNQKSIYVFAKWQVKESQLETVLGLLSDVAKKSVQEEGNLYYKIHQSNNDPNLILLYEGYTSEQAVQAHRDSEHFQSLVAGKIVPLLESREVILTSLVEAS